MINNQLLSVTSRISDFSQLYISIQIQLGGDRKIGNVGPPMPCNLIKLIDVPDLGYFADKNGGEILLKGYNVTSGYLKDPEATKAAFDEDGYMRTGDIGRFSEDGALEIIDRRKNVFKLPQVLLFFLV